MSSPPQPPSFYTTCESCKGKFPFILRNNMCKNCIDELIQYLDEEDDINPCIAECGGTVIGHELFCEECKTNRANVKEDQDIRHPKKPD